MYNEGLILDLEHIATPKVGQVELTTRLSSAEFDVLEVEEDSVRPLDVDGVVPPYP